jgi:hypothetical protein
VSWIRRAPQRRQNLSVKFGASALQAWQILKSAVSLSSILFIFPLLDDLSQLILVLRPYRLKAFAEPEKKPTACLKGKRRACRPLRFADTPDYVPCIVR